MCHLGIGLLVDSEIVLSTRYGKTMVFINETLSTETVYQQDLINRDILSTSLIVGKVGPGMWCGKGNRNTHYPGTWIVTVRVRTDHPVQPLLYLSISKPYQLSSTDPPLSKVG
jgi:hypothetical protein